MLNKIQDNLYNKALERRNKMTYEVKNFNEFKHVIENTPGFVKAPWCGEEKCELKAKEVRGCKSRCIIGENHEDECIFCGKQSTYDVWWGIQY